MLLTIILSHYKFQIMQPGQNSQYKFSIRGMINLLIEISQWKSTHNFREQTFWMKNQEQSFRISMDPHHLDLRILIIKVWLQVAVHSTLLQVHQPRKLQNWLNFMKKTLKTKIFRCSKVFLKQLNKDWRVQRLRDYLVHLRPQKIFMSLACLSGIILGLYSSSTISTFGDYYNHKI